MSRVELYERIRKDNRDDGLSIRALADRYHVHRRTVREALASATPTGRKVPEREAVVLGPWMELIRSWLVADRSVARKQRHTARRVHQRLSEECGASLAESTVRAFEAIRRLAERVGLARERPVTTSRGHEPGRNLPPDQERRLLTTFLAERRWCSETATELGLSVVLDQRGRRRVRFPFRLADQPIGWQDRLLGPGEPRWLSSPGPIRCPYEVDRLTRAHEVGAVWMVEGVSDCAAVIDAWPDAAVVGVPGAGGLKPTWVSAFVGLAVYIVADADDAGDKLRASVDQYLSPVAAAVHHVRVPPAQHDLDGWRLACGEDRRFEAELMAASEEVEA